MKTAYGVIGLLAFVATLILAGVVEATGGAVPAILAGAALAIMAACALAAERR